MTIDLNAEKEVMRGIEHTASCSVVVRHKRGPCLLLCSASQERFVPTFSSGFSIRLFDSRYSETLVGGVVQTKAPTSCGQG